MNNQVELSGLIERILASQRFGVLATQSEGQPYADLITFAEANNLRSLLFVTGREGQIYKNSLINKKVAVLVENTTNQQADVKNAVAVTALGVIKEVDPKNHLLLSELYLAKQPHLKEFVHNPAKVLMEIVISSYIVATFDKARYWQL
jgi:heme iron utilization protein